MTRMNLQTLTTGGGVVLLAMTFFACGVEDAGR